MMWPSNEERSKWWHEAHKCLDKCQCGGLVSLNSKLVGYSVKCVCGKQVVEPTALHAVISWNKLARGVNK